MTDENDGRNWDRRRLLKASGVLVAGLAGCSGGDTETDAGTAEPTETPTATPTATPTPEPTPTATETPTPEPTPTPTEEPLPSIEEFEYPGGATADGLSPTLASVHADTIVDAGSVTITEVGERTSSGGHTSDIDKTKRISAAGVRVDSATGDVTERLWAPASESKSYVQMDAGFEQRYRIQPGGPTPDEALGRETIQRFLQAADWGGVTEIAEFETRPVARYEATAVADERSALRLHFGERVESLEASISVTQEGYIAQYDYDITVARDDGTSRKAMTVTVDGVGETEVAEPDWFQTAVENGHEIQADVVEDGRVVRLDVTNGPAVEGLRAQVAARNAFADGLVTETVAEGDTLNLSIGDDGSLTYAVNELPEQTTAFERSVFVALTDEQFTLFESNLRV